MPTPNLNPQFPNPYIADYHGQDVVAFEYLDPLILRREIDAVKMRGGADDAEYVVGAPYRVRYRLAGEAQSRTITVPKGMLTDLSSVPRLLRGIVGQVGPHLEASIVHDFLYVAWQDTPGWTARSEDWDFANKIMRAGMVEATVDDIQIHLIYTAVDSFFGWSVYQDDDPPPRYVVVP